MGRPMGCTLAFANPSDPTALCCNERVNKMVRPFSEGLPSMLNQLKSNVTGACFFVTNDFEFLADIKSNPNNKYGEYPELMLKCFLSSKIETCFIEFYFIFFAFEGITNTMDACYNKNDTSHCDCPDGSDFDSTVRTMCFPQYIIQLVSASSV